MITREVWEDKLPEDKAKYYNRTRMSLDLFSKKVGVSPQEIQRDLASHHYMYDESARRFEKRPTIVKRKLCS